MTSSLSAAIERPMTCTFDPGIDLGLKRFQAAHSAPVLDVPRDVSRVLKTIHARLFDPELNVQTVKSTCGIQDNNISSRFKHAMGGTSIKDYIDNLRLAAAREVLATSSRSIFDVALAVGYAHPQTFYRVFRRQFGDTPGRTRLRQEG